MALWRKTTTAENLDLSKSGLEKLVSNDPTFPKPIKMGSTRQAAVYFDSEEVNTWIEAQKAKRVEVANAQ